jgi:hypothetical protein
MRRLMILNVLVLFLCSVISLGCSAGSERSISQSDIPDLIGKWEGNCFAGVDTELVTMQILNNRGKDIFSTCSFWFPVDSRRGIYWQDRE